MSADAANGWGDATYPNVVYGGGEDHVLLRLRATNSEARCTRLQNFISATTVRDITFLKGDFFAALSDIGFVPLSATADSPSLNVNGENTNLIKAIILGGLWPRVARIALPKATFDRVAAGTVQREHVAKELKIFDKDEGRVFLHPSSVLFGIASYKSPFIAYFSMNATSKTFLRDATEVQQQDPIECDDDGP
jgi:ATP-dependent RNA helicase DHX57